MGSHKILFFILLQYVLLTSKGNLFASFSDTESMNSRWNKSLWFKNKIWIIQDFLCRFLKEDTYDAFNLKSFIIMVKTAILFYTCREQKQIHWSGFHGRVVLHTQILVRMIAQLCKLPKSIPRKQCTLK